MKSALRLAILLLVLPVCAANGSEDRVLRHSAAWGTEGSAAGQFRSPTSLALDSAGNVYVVDQGNHRIQKFSPRGRLRSQWGRNGTAASEFRYPTGIAVSPRGEVFITDQMNSRVQVFDTSGVYLRQWGSEGAEPGQFSNPTGIAVGGQGSVYVADPASGRVQEFTSDGKLQAVWGPRLHGDVTLSNPTGVACNGFGLVYVFDSKTNSLLEFSADGDLRKAWDPEGELGISLYRLVDVSFDPDGNIVLLDAGRAGGFLRGARDPKIVVVQKDGTPVTQTGSGDQGIGALQQPSAIAVAATGWIYVADSGDNRVQVLAEEPIELWQETSQGATVAALGSAAAVSSAAMPAVTQVLGSRGSDPGECKSPAGVAAGPDSVIYVVDSGNHRIQRWNPAGGFSRMWGRKGDGEGEFRSPVDVAVDIDGNVFVVDRDNHRIQVFDAAGNFLAAWGSNGSGEGQFRDPVSITAAGDGHIYVADKGNRRIQKFRADGSFVAAWGPSLSDEEDLEQPTGVCVDANNNLIVVDAETGKLHRLDSDGSLLMSLNLESIPHLEVYTPVVIDIDSSGYLYILDEGRMPEPFEIAKDARLTVLSPTDSLVVQLGKNGDGPGEFDSPSGLAVYPSGRIMVADTGNDRIQVFAWVPEGTVPEVAGLEHETPPRIVKEISIEVWKPFLDGDGDRFSTGLVTPAIEWSFSNRVAAVGRMPLALLDFGPGQSETALGNPCLGVRFGPSHQIYTDIGVWLPLADRDNSSALFIGLITDVDMWEAYLPSTLSLYTESRGEITLHPSLALGLRAACSVSINTHGGDATSWLPYGAWLKFLSRNVRVQGGLTGRVHLSFSNGNDALNRTQVLLGGDFGTWRLKPGLALRVWLNGDYREVAPAVLGLTLQYDFKR